MLISDDACTQVLLNIISDQQKEIQKLNNKLNNLIQNYDVVEVVRCKDCIFGKYDDDLNMILCKRIYNLSDGEYIYNDLNDFCSYGGKKCGDDNA